MKCKMCRLKDPNLHYGVCVRCWGNIEYTRALLELKYGRPALN